MGKKSKSKSKAAKPKGDRRGGAGGGAGGGGGGGENAIPRLRHFEGGKRWAELTNELGNPVLMVDSDKSWVCTDDDVYVSSGGITFEQVEETQVTGAKVARLGPDDGLRNDIPAPTACRICFKAAKKCCSKCRSIYYCSSECQAVHWKMSHKKACKPNPGLYQYDVSVSQFRSLPANAFEGHEFIVINPTKKLSSLQQICDECLESADDILETVPGFGAKQLDSLWTYENNGTSPIAKSLQERFGWLSGTHGVELLLGYQMAEDHVVYRVMFDNNMMNRRDLDPSYYGDACFDWIRKGRHVRGKLVVFKLLVKNKRRVPPNHPPGFRMEFQVTDDVDLHFEFELYPTTKAEVAHMLQERMAAIEQGRYSRRQWRKKIREEEMLIEGEAHGVVMQFP